MPNNGSQAKPKSLRTFVVYVEDKPGVLNRAVSLFRRRNFNIDSLAVGHSDQPGVSRMTIVIEADARTARLVEANLYKLVNVLRVEDVSQSPAVMRDLALIKATGIRVFSTKSKSTWVAPDMRTPCPARMMGRFASLMSSIDCSKSSGRARRSGR